MPDTMGPHGMVLFQARWSRIWAMFIVLVTGAMTTVLLSMVLRPDAAGGVRVVLGVLLLVAGAGLVSGLRQLFRPMLMHEATERGIVTYLNGSSYGGEGFLIPWERVKSLALVRRTMMDAGRRARVETIAIETRVDPGWRPPEGVSYRPDGSSSTVHLDARTCRPERKELLEQLRRLHALYGAGS